MYPVIRKLQFQIQVMLCSSTLKFISHVNFHFMLFNGEEHLPTISTMQGPSVLRATSQARSNAQHTFSEWVPLLMHIHSNCCQKSSSDVTTWTHHTHNSTQPFLCEHDSRCYHSPYHVNTIQGVTIVLTIRTRFNSRCYSPYCVNRIQSVTTVLTM